ncbi:hypothetical protein IMG5_119950 [Ichthyophthirius multifiliis]|uniref:Uncharacterized protein n=1 Tax=Ichthyophthirius multifiliis TaxID=5932 RepID=G0QUX4_ICHMU|nr:hypothetical protein IMG5_119950 [Ichthyophthirius multifiliis]EGR30979.1 hypothetical protein IMG5_119950 [Ichthyophthirius multifiliis]|eukprot:XP_004034465.1 hypothetical protein IMG5_119950 [Ichthyophthirius multifiliis]
MISRNIYSLFRKANQQSIISQNIKNWFGSAVVNHNDHHDHHGHNEHHDHGHDQELVSIYGFDDVNVHEHHDETDPYAHIRNKPFLSFERLYFADPYYIPDEVNPLMNEPHGYLTNDDPLDTRPNFEVSTLQFLYIALMGIGITIIFGHQGLNRQRPAELLFNANLTAENIEEKLREIRIQNQELENQKSGLNDELESLQ